MKAFNRNIPKIQLRDFIPPILIRFLDKIRRAISSSSTIKTVIKHPVQYYACPALESYSQFHEDLLIDFLLLSKGKGFYIDVGSNDPVFNSNTKRFYDRGWRGINIEPARNQFEKVSSARQRDINLNIGVGDVNGKLIFYGVDGDSTLSSFDKNVATRMADAYALEVVESEVCVLRLADIYRDHVKGNHVDFMSVDAEGLDLDVLKSNDWDKFRPTLVMAEVDSQYHEIIEYLDKNQYLLLFNNNHNAIFLDKKASEPNLRKIVTKALS